MMPGATRWGICGAGLISDVFCCAKNLLNPENHELVAVAARDPAKAKVFAEKYKIQHVYNSYEELAKADGIDIVYIGTIHPTHYDLCMLMMKHGKNVLCEKPLTMNCRLATQLVEMAKQQNVFFMEAFWSRMFPVYDKIREEIAAGSIGDVMKIDANMTQNIQHVPRLHTKSLGGGAMLDLGIYLLQFVVMIFPGEDPIDIQVSGLLNDDGVDLCEAIQLTYSGNRYVQLYCDIRYDSHCGARICGTKSTIELPTYFWCPSEVITPSGRFEYPLPGKTTCFPQDQGMIYELEAVRKCLQKVLKECPLIPWSDTIRIARLSDQIREKLGVVYDQD